MSPSLNANVFLTFFLSYTLNSFVGLCFDLVTAKCTFGSPCLYSGHVCTPLATCTIRQGSNYHLPRKQDPRFPSRILLRRRLRRAGGGKCHCPPCPAATPLTLQRQAGRCRGTRQFTVLANAGDRIGLYYLWYGYAGWWPSTRRVAS